MKRPQWITIVAAFILLAILYIFGRVVPEKKPVSAQPPSNASNGISTDTILAQARRALSPDQIKRMDAIEKLASGNSSGGPEPGLAKQRLNAYHQLAHFWLDTGQIFEPYGWYEAQAARLENSEKSLTFAAHLFLQNLRGEGDPDLRSWKAHQARDLFERSLKINPNNDSSIVGLGACYIFGNISESPMEGIMKIREVVRRDSTNVFAQEVLGHGSMLSGQYDKAISRFESVYRLSEKNKTTRLEACLMLAEAYERKAEKGTAIEWYEKSLSLIQNEQIKAEVGKRIEELKK